MILKKITNLQSPQINNSWVYVKYMKGNTKNVYHKIMHVIDIPDNYTYKIDHISSLFEPEYWERDAVYQMMSNVIMTDSMKKIVNDMMNQYQQSNVYTSHMNIGDDTYYIDDISSVYILSEKDAKYLLELFKNFNNYPVSKYKLDFLTNSYPEIYGLDKQLSENEMLFQYAKAGTKLYIVIKNNEIPKIKTCILDGPFILQKNKNAKTTYNSHNNVIIIPQDYLNYKSYFNYFLCLEDAKKCVLSNINDRLDYISKRLIEIDTEKNDLIKLEQKLKQEKENDEGSK